MRDPRGEARQPGWGAGAVSGASADGLCARCGCDGSTMVVTSPVWRSYTWSETLICGGTLAHFRCWSRPCSVAGAGLPGRRGRRALGSRLRAPLRLFRLHRPPGSRAGRAGTGLPGVPRLRRRRRRRDAPSPVATTLFHLTDAGAELESVLDAIFRWGVRYMIEPAFPVSSFLRDRDPDGPPGEPMVRPRRNASVELALSRTSAACPEPRDRAQPPCPRRGTSSCPALRSST
jgi:hypothetical protein